MAEDAVAEELPPVESKGPIVVLWTVQTSCILLTAIATGYAMIALEFLLVPLLMAYFVIFLMAPILDVMEKRPLASPCGDLPENEEEWNLYEKTYESKMLCVGGYENDRRASIVKKKNAQTPAQQKVASPLDGQLAMAELTLMIQIPHMVASLLTLAICVVILGICGSIIGSSFASFADGQAAIQECEICLDTQAPPAVAGECPWNTEKNTPNCGFEATLPYKLVQEQNNFVDVTLKDMGVIVFKDKYCRPIDEPVLLMQQPDKDGNYIVNTYLYGMYKSESRMGEFKYRGDYNNDTCDDLLTFRDTPMPLDELMSTLGAVGGLVERIVLILMLMLFILLERPIGQTFPGDSLIAAEIEGMVMNYISLKFLLSAMTGAIVGIIMVLCGVKIGAVWGLLAFMLNFIPNVGSMIAMVLPLPFILLDEEMINNPGLQTVALLGPAAVQGYVGNALEPGLFGASLNLTEISVLLSLVLFSYIWGLYGAVLSVPVLGAMKIVLHHTPHPLAKTALASIRQNAQIDVDKDDEVEAYEERKAKLKEYTDELFAPSQSDLDEAAAAEAAASSGDAQQAMD
jgi:predicted PurR-regulated permease PerM